MHIAILGYGRQGKKHAHFWRLIGEEPKIFTRLGGDGTLPISEFRSSEYAIIVYAVAPIVEQTSLLWSIIISEYRGYLIIEKPITYDTVLLDILVDREYTVFFIDEAYIDTHVDLRVSYISQLRIHSSVAEGDSAIQEHALGLTLRSNVDTIQYTGIHSQLVDTDGQYFFVQTDTYILEFKEGVYLLNNEHISASFDRIYGFLFRRMLDHAMMGCIRKNYKKLRNQFFKI